MLKGIKHLRILLVNTGGTIAAQMKADGSYGRATLKATELLSKLSLSSNITCDSIDLPAIISHNITTKDRFALADTIESNSDYDGVIVTHGTNTLPETAFFLDVSLSLPRPIVLTGAMFPFGSPYYDGFDNLKDAFTILASEWPKGISVVTTFDHLIASAFGVCKTVRNGKLAIGCPSEASLGNISNGTVHWNKAPAIPTYCQHKEAFSKVKALPWIPIYYDHPDGEAVLDAILAQDPEGLIVVGAGDGFINEALAQKIKDTGIPTMRASKVTGAYASWRRGYDDKYGMIPTGMLSPEKAQILLGFALAANIDLTPFRSGLLFWDVFAKYTTNVRVNFDNGLGK